MVMHDNEFSPIMRPDTRRRARPVALFFLCLIMGLAGMPVQAAPSAAPSLPLPPCTTESNGQQTGACLTEDDEVSVDAGGRFNAGASLMLYGGAEVPACDTFSDQGMTWSPSPCYSESTLIVGEYQCYYIDLRDKAFKAGDCFDVLYQNPAEVKAGLDTSSSGTNRGLFYRESDVYIRDNVARVRPGCHHGGDFYTYHYGGDASKPEAHWSSRAADARKCEVTFRGPRPDGMYGPTWAVGSFNVVEEYTGNGFRGGRNDIHRTNRRSGQTYIPIDGDLRDLGVVAEFSLRVEGRKIFTDNQSVDTDGGTLSYDWRFGDNETSTAVNPTHVYESGGNYTVTLTARDNDGNEDSASHPATAVEALVVSLTKPAQAPKVGEQGEVTVDIQNYETSDLGNLTLDFTVDTSRLDVVDGPSPALPSTLAKDASTAVVYTVEALASGNATLQATAGGQLAQGRTVTGEDSDILAIPIRIALELSSSVESETRVGDELQIFLKLTNNEDVTVDGITVEPLGIMPNELLSTVSGPTAPDGSDPRVNRISLAPGESTTITFTYKAEQKGAGTVSAFVAGNDPFGGGRFTAGTDDTVAIESAAIAISELRLTPATPSPGSFPNLRGTITNKGSIDVTDIDVSLPDAADIDILEKTLAELDPSVSPRIATLAVDESRDFLIPLGFRVRTGLTPTYQLVLRMQGSAELDGQDVDVVDSQNLAGTLDRENYWTSILDETRERLTSSFQRFIVATSDLIDDIGDSSTLGGIQVGQIEGVIGALKKMGDGLLTVGDVAVNTAQGEYHLTEKGKAIMQALHEYRATHTNKQMLVDLANLEEEFALAVPDATVGTFADWLFEIDTAYSKGDTREVSRLITEPAVQVALAAGNEAAVSRAFAPVLEKIVANATVRRLLNGTKKGVEDEIVINLLDPDQVAPPLTTAEREALAAKFYTDTGADIEDIPTGVPLTRETVARAGIADEEYTELVSVARSENATIYARPRPQEAAAYAKLGYNAKPMPVKIKSITDVDVKWLGYPDKQALVPLKEPLDPYPALKDALEAKEIDIDEALDVMDRYNLRKAEWEEHTHFLTEANSLKTVTDADGNVLETYKGIKVKRFGKEVVTELYVDGEGLLRYTINDLPVYSDIDIYYIGEPGGPISLEKYRKVTNELDVTADQQHRTTANSADFPNQEVANKFIKRYGDEHKRGGEPLLIIGPNATTFGYVDRLELNPATVTGSNEALYNQLVTVSFEGDSIGAIAP